MKIWSCDRAGLWSLARISSRIDDISRTLVANKEASATSKVTDGAVRLFDGFDKSAKDPELSLGLLPMIMSAGYPHALTKPRKSKLQDT